MYALSCVKNAYGEGSNEVMWLCGKVVTMDRMTLAGTELLGRFCHPSSFDLYYK